MKKILIISFILGFLALNIFAFRDFYFNFNGNKFYIKNDFNTAKNYFDKSQTKEGIYNSANSLYKLGKYDDSLKKYLSIISENKTPFDFSLLHNIGNTYYKLSLKDNQNEIEKLEKSASYYQKALDIKYDEQTKKNLDFVLEKLKKAKSKEDNKVQQENNNVQKEGNKGQPQGIAPTGSGQTNSGTGENSEKSGTGVNQNNSSGSLSNSGSGKTGEKNNLGADFMSAQEKTNSGTQKQELSKEMQDKLKAYEESLKQSQKQNQNQVGKVYQEQNSNDPFSQFDNFFDNPFFDNSLLNKDENKKDW